MVHCGGVVYCSFYICLLYCILFCGVCCIHSICIVLSFSCKAISNYTRGSANVVVDFLVVKAAGEYKCAWHLRERLGLAVFLGRRRCGVMIGPGVCVMLSDAGGGGTGFIAVGLMCCVFVFSNFVRLHCASRNRKLTLITLDKPRGKVS